MRPRTARNRRRPSWSSTRREIPSGLGWAVQDRRVPVVQPRRTAFGLCGCASCSEERRTNGDGRPGSGEHGIYVDAKDNVWLTGNGDGDGQILKFTKDGKFLLQIGRGGAKATATTQSI